MPFTVTPDRKLARAAGGSIRYLRVSIEAPEAAPREDRTPVNISLVLDRSGSMAGEKIERAREAAIGAVRSLRAEDRFSAVFYDNRIDLVMPSRQASAAARAEAERAIGAVRARGSTNLCGGWLRGCEQVAEHLADDAVGRTLLLTDGLANVGITAPEEIVAHARALRSRGISTTTFGVGADFNETLLQRMAEAGGGNFYFIEHAGQIADFVASEMGEVLQVVARDAAVIVETPPEVTVESLNDYPVRREGNAWTVTLGSLVSGQLSDAVLAVRLPAGQEGETVALSVRIRDRDGALDGGTVPAAFSFASHEDNDAQARDREVDRLVATLYASRAERSAAERNREGDYAGAYRVLESCARRIRGYAGDDVTLRHIADDLLRKSLRYGEPMDVMTRKRAHFASTTSLKDKMALGTSRRRAGGIVVLPTVAELVPLAWSASRALRYAGRRRFPGIDVARALVEQHRADEAAERAAAELSSADESALVATARALAGDAAVRMVSTLRRLPDNWFSHWHDGDRVVVSSLWGWEQTAEVAPEAFLAYEMVLYGLHALSPRYRFLDLAHEETRGCLFDFCMERADIEIKLQTADLCDPCRAKLDAARIPPELVAELCEAIRSLARPDRRRLRPHA